MPTVMVWQNFIPGEFGARSASSWHQEMLFQTEASSQRFQNSHWRSIRPGTMSRVFFFHKIHFRSILQHFILCAPEQLYNSCLSSNRRNFFRSCNSALCCLCSRRALEFMHSVLSSGFSSVMKVMWNLLKDVQHFVVRAPEELSFIWYVLQFFCTCSILKVFLQSPN